MKLDGQIRPQNYAFILSVHKKYMKTLSEKCFARVLL
jgi:hypothetical protein